MRTLKSTKPKIEKDNFSIDENDDLQKYGITDIFKSEDSDDEDEDED